MSSRALKLAIRRLVLATSFPPFLSVYKRVYELVAELAVRLFRQYPEVRSIYLRRGGAKGEIVPLVSDIDFALIVDPMSEGSLRDLHARYGRLARTTTLLDRSLEVYDQESLRRLYEKNAYFRFRFVEGKKTWKLLYGEDYLAELPQPPIESLYGGFVTEIKVWWMAFAWRFYHDRKYRAESLTRNSLCFKTVTEVLKMELALRQGFLTFDRAEALDRALPGLTGEDLALAHDLRSIWQRGFRSSDPSILERTHRFLLRYLNRLFGQLRTHPVARPRNGITQRLDDPWDGSFLESKEAVHLRALVDWAVDRWGERLLGARVASGVYFNLDDILLFLEVDPTSPPTLEQTLGLNRFHLTLDSRLRKRVRVFLLAPNAGFQINVEEFKQSWQSILLPSANPEIFEMLGSSRAALLPGTREEPAPDAWTPLVEYFFVEEKELFYELLENPAIYKLNELDFLRVFWKTAQLVVLNRAAARGQIVYPLTLPALVRALDAAGIPLPPELHITEHAYRAAIAGRETEGNASVVPRALAWLREIDT